MLPQPYIPVLELASTVEHDDAQTYLEVATLLETRNDDVQKGPTDYVTPIFHVEHVDVHEDVDDNY